MGSHHRVCGAIAVDAADARGDSGLNWVVNTLSLLGFGMAGVNSDD